MSDRRLILAVLAGALLVSPAAASAADYHHVHLTASNATEAIGWYSRHLDCEPLSDRDDGVECDGCLLYTSPSPRD